MVSSFSLASVLVSASALGAGADWGHTKDAGAAAGSGLEDSRPAAAAAPAPHNRLEYEDRGGGLVKMAARVWPEFWWI